MIYIVALLILALACFIFGIVAMRSVSREMEKMDQFDR